nr:amidoligase family protein [Haliangium ochraceum]
MHTLRFGIEIETIGQTRERVADAIRSVVGGHVDHVGQPYCHDPYDVIAADGRRWRVMADASLQAPKHHQAEIVSPILHYADIATLPQEPSARSAAQAAAWTAPAASTCTSTGRASTSRRCAIWSRWSTNRSA